MTLLWQILIMIYLMGVAAIIAFGIRECYRTLKDPKYPTVVPYADNPLTLLFWVGILGCFIFAVVDIARVIVLSII